MPHQQTPPGRETSRAGVYIFATGKEGLEAFLGPLEARLMDILWEEDRPMTIKDMYRAIELDDPRTLTTVQVTLNRLADKGILIRRPTTPYTYVPVSDRATFLVNAGRAIIAALEDVLGSDALGDLIQHRQITTT